VHAKAEIMSSATVDKRLAAGRRPKRLSLQSLYQLMFDTAIAHLLAQGSDTNAGN
jgi:hypothetical protein